VRIRFLPPEAPLAGVVALSLGRGARGSGRLAALDPDRRWRKALRRAGFDPAAGEVETLLAPPPPFAALVVAGVGRGAPRPKAARRIGAALWEAFDETAAVVATVALDLDPRAVAEVAYGLLLRSHPDPDQYRTRRDPDDPDDYPPALAEVRVLCADPALAEAAFDRHRAVAAGVAWARDLTLAPGNRLGPAELAAEARRLDALGVEVTVLDGPALAAAGLGLLSAVGQGSARPPRLVVLRWRGAVGRPLVLVGKGITFDSGGISIKADDEDMDAMIADMAGAAAVLGAMRAIAGRRAAAHVVGVLAVAENMPSGGAQRPGDVWRACDGTTVEVIDTDAEGRLALADALAWSVRALAPRAIVDIATLTGSVEDLLGGYHAGLYVNDDRFAARILACAKAEDEPVWRLPIREACDESLRSEIADLKHCAWEDGPDNDDAARFLWHFVPEGIAWAHIDMAGLEFTDEDHPFAPESASGFGVRLFDALAGG